VAFQLAGSGQSSIQLIRAQDQKVMLESSPKSQNLQRIVWDASNALGQDLYLQVNAARGNIAVAGIEVFQPRSSSSNSLSIPNPNFATGTLAGWDEVGKTFMVQTGDQGNILSSARAGMDGTGSLYSAGFRIIESGRIRLKLSGTNDLAAVYLALIRASDDHLLFKASGNNTKTLREIQWDASDYQDTEVYLKVTDQSTKGSLNVADLEVNIPNAAGFVQRTAPNLDFETGDLTGWKLQGNAFTVSKNRNSRTGIAYKQQGKYHVGGNPDQSDSQTGRLQSQTFTLSGSGKISFKISGNNDPQTHVALVREADGQALFTASGNGSESYQTLNWDGAPYLGSKVFLEVVDQSQQGHINVDQFRVYQGLIAAWNFDEAQDSTAREQISGQPDPIQYVFNQAKFKPSSSPEWRSGLQLTSLMFDGYSTFLEHQLPLLKLSDAFTLEAWVAPRNFEWGDGGQLSAVINQHNPTSQEGFILGIGRHGKWGLMLGMGGRWQMVWADDSGTLPKHAWSHLAANFDRDQHRVRLYLNGREVATQDIPDNTRLSLSSETLLLGKHNAPVIINGVFPVNMFSGLMDEVKIYNIAQTESEIRQSYRAVTNSFPNKSLPAARDEMNRKVYAGDKYRPTYHFIPPGHWMNEPHAPIFYNGQYHLFYQQNVQGPYWHNIQWGHQISTDLVHWRDAPEALSPSFATAAPDGVWSGSAFKTALGEPLLFITAGNDSARPNQAMAIAHAYNWQQDPDLTEWKMPKSIAIGQKADLNVGKSLKVKIGEFRDPFVWRSGPTWFALIGSGLQTLEGKDVGGTALLYTSTDLSDWTYVGPLMTGNANKYPASGQVWELPVFLPIGKNAHGQAKYVFMINPAFTGRSPYQVKYVWYWVGSWNAQERKFQPDRLEPRLFDYGEHFTGPSGLVDEQGRTVIFSIAQDKRSEQDHYDAGWAHNAGLPLQIFLNNQGDLGVKPIKETQSLRQKKLLELKNSSLAKANAALQSIKGDELEIEMELSVPQTKTELCVRCSPDGHEATLLGFDPKTSLVLIDRSKANLGVQSGKLPKVTKSLKWRIFLDKSMIEAYVDDSKSITSRVYSTQANALGLKLFGDVNIKVLTMKIWSMGAAY
jgi:fructan beta-fructosidase